MRDSQKQKAYNAENVLRTVLRRDGDIEMFGHTMSVPMERKFASIESVQDFCDYVLEHPTVKEAFPHASPVRVRARKGRTLAHYQAGEIAVPPHKEGGNNSWAMREIVVLHEIAHHLAFADGHGPRWCGTFVKLVELVMSPEAAWLLSVYMDGEGCKVLPWGHVQTWGMRVQ